jgi:hypothetical protein
MCRIAGMGGAEGVAIRRQRGEPELPQAVSVSFTT